MNQKKLFSALPAYSILPIIAMIGMNCLAYFGTRLISAGRFHYNIESPLDHLIPVIPAFVVKPHHCVLDEIIYERMMVVFL